MARHSLKSSLVYIFFCNLLSLFFLTTLHGQTFRLQPLTHSDGFFFLTDLNNKGDMSAVLFRNNGDINALLKKANGEVITLPGVGGTNIQAVAINDSGHVAGFSTDAAGFGHAGVWDANGFNELTLPADATGFAVIDINNLRQVSGAFNDGSGVSHALRWESDGTFQILPDLAGGSGFANALNNNGDVVGMSADANSNNHAVRWQQLPDESFEIKDLGTLGGATSRANDINDSGQIVGSADVPATFTHAFLWENDLMTDLGTLGGDFSRAFSINESGVIVGPSQVSGNSSLAFPASGHELAQFAPPEAFTTLKFPMKGFDKFGIMTAGPDNGYIWLNGRMQNINQLVPQGSNEINEVFVINNSDLIGTFNFTEVENCLGVPYDQRISSTENNKDKVDNIDFINTSNGELAFDEPSFLKLDGNPVVLGPGWRFNISYATRAALDAAGPCATGANWQHNYELNMTRFGNDHSEVLMPRGRVLLFAKDAGNSGQMTSRQNINTWNLIVKQEIPFQLVESGSDFILGDPRNNLMYTFNPSGELTKIENGKGYVQTLTHTNGKLTKVTDSFGRSLTFEYDQDHLMRVSDGTRDITLAHTGDLLTSVTDPDGNVTTYAYDATHPMPGLMTSKTLPAGNSPFTITYDENGRVVSRADANGNSTTFDYLSNGNGSASSLSKLAATTEAVITDPLGNIRRCFYNENGQVVTLTDPAGKSISIGYDNLGRRNSITDRTGATTSWDFHDPSGRVSAIHNPDGTTINFAYASRSIAGLTFYDLASITFPDGTSETLVHDGSGNLTSATEQAGNTNILTYNNFGQVLSITNPEGGVTTFSYNNDGTPASIIDPAGNMTTLSFDGLRRLEQITFADGASRTLTYNNNNQALTVTDGRGNTTEFTYDNNRNRVSKMDALGNTTTFAFDQMDRLIRATDPAGNSVLLDYNEVGKVKTWTDRLGNGIAFNYAAGGRLTSITDGDGNTSFATYTDESILASISDPIGNTISFTSDNMARLNEITTPLGNVTRFGRDVMGRANSIDNRLGLPMVALNYDPNGLLTSANLATGAVTSYTRNGLGNVTEARDFIGNLWSFDRNNRGLFNSATDPLGNTRQYSYNSRNKPSKVVFPGGLGSVDVSYDANGNPTNLQYSDSAPLNFDYDALNRPVSATGVSLDYNANSRITESNGLAMTRDARGRISSVTLAPGKTVTYEYNNRHLITKVTDWLNGMTTFTYDAAGRLTQLTRPNGTVATYDYDAENQVSKITDTKSTNTGNSAKKGVDRAQHSAQVDTLVAIKLFRNSSGQVVKAERNVPATGSLTASTTTLSYDAASQISDFDYNAMGQLTSDDLRSYTWNLATRLTGYTEDGATIGFTYDALGGRLTRSDGNSTQAYVWNYAFRRPSVSVVKQDGSNLRYYIHTPTGNLLYSIEESDDSRRYYHYDEIGNTVALSNEQAAIVASYVYSPYGRILGESGSGENPFTYLGRHGVTREGSSGLYYMRERYYDSRNGRFISRESTDPLGFNPYQYGFGNPLRFINPVGVSISALFLFLPLLGGWFRRHSKGIILCSLLSLLTVSGCGGGCTDAEFEAFWHGLDTGDFSRFEKLVFGESPFFQAIDNVDGTVPENTVLSQGSDSKNRGTEKNNFFFFTSALPRSVDPPPAAAADDFFLGPGLELRNGGFLKAIYTDREYQDFVDDFVTSARGTTNLFDTNRAGIINEQQATISNIPDAMATAVNLAGWGYRGQYDPSSTVINVVTGDQSNSFGGDSPLDALGLPMTLTPPSRRQFARDNDFQSPREFRFSVGFRF